METKIRKMILSDADKVASLEQICFSQPWSRKAVEDSLEDPNSLFFVAECGGKFAGYSELMKSVDEGFVCNIAVVPELRGNGVGKALVEALIEAGREEKLSLISLEVRVGNEKAISLYSKCGFVNVGRRKNLYSHPLEDGYVYNYYYQKDE